MRPNWSEYFLTIARDVAARADCTRRAVGAVLVKDHRIVATGYNGAPSGSAGCLEGACPRGRHYRTSHPGGPPADTGPVKGFGKFCGCGNAWPCTLAAQPGQSYDTGPGACISLHAEQNAIIYADYDKCRGATLYSTDEPCDGCRRLIAGAGIKCVVWPDGFWDLFEELDAW